MLTVEDLLREAEKLGVEVIEATLPHPYFGYYDDQCKAITIARGLRSWQLRCSLCHELIHARYRDHGCSDVAGIRAERRARRQTSLRLIDHHEYASAENLYDGDVFSIACELDVTCQVVEDYRRLVLVDCSFVGGLGGE